MQLAQEPPPIISQGDRMDSNFAYFWGNTATTGQYARKVDSCPMPILNQKYPGYCANDFGLYHMLEVTCGNGRLTPMKIATLMHLLMATWQYVVK